MNKYDVMFFTYSNHATQFMKVQAENKAEAKAKRIAAKMNELVDLVSGGPDCMIDFAIGTNNGLRSYSSYISDESVDCLVTKQVRTSAW